MIPILCDLSLKKVVLNLYLIEFLTPKCLLMHIFFYSWVFRFRFLSEKVKYFLFKNQNTSCLTFCSSLLIVFDQLSHLHFLLSLISPLSGTGLSPLHHLPSIRRKRSSRRRVGAFTVTCFLLLGAGDDRSGPQCRNSSPALFWQRAQAPKWRGGPVPSLRKDYLFLPFNVQFAFKIDNCGGIFTPQNMMPYRKFAEHLKKQLKKIIRIIKFGIFYGKEFHFKKYTF